MSVHEIKRYKKCDIWICDTESESVDFYEKHGYTKTWACYGEHLTKDASILTIGIWDFISRIIRNAKKYRKSQILYFHNLSWDAQFILWALEDKSPYEWEYVINDQKRVYNIKIWLDQWTCIDIRCSYLLLMAPVSALPNSTKGSIDYNAIRNYKSIKEITEEELGYIVNDVRSVKETLKNMNEDFFQLNSENFQTIASCSYKEQISHLDEKLIPPITLEEDTFCRKAYSGGYVYTNPKYVDKLITKPLQSYDITSSYPHKQRDKILPFGKIYFHEHDRLPKDELFIVEIQLHHARIKSGYHPFIPKHKMFRKINSEIYPKELSKTILYLTSVDYELFTRYYDATYEIIRHCTFEYNLTGMFNEYIDKYFDMKASAKQSGNKFMESGSKLRINSPYGKYGTNPCVRSARYEIINDKMVWETYEEFSEKSYYVPIACFITAYGRYDLIEGIQANADRFVYCDTDSIKLVGLEPPKNMWLDDRELGAFKHEYTTSKFKVLKSKQYICEIGGKTYTTLASLSKANHNKVNFDNFEKGLVIPKGKMVSTKVKGGCIIKEIDFTFS